RLLVVADGLDEASAADRDGPVQHRVHRAAHHPHWELLVTGTRTSWERVCRGATGARVLQLEPLAGSEIDALLEAGLPATCDPDRARAWIESHRGTLGANLLLLRGLW